MRRAMYGGILAACLGLAMQVEAKTDGVLLLGTQTEVKAALAQTHLVPKFSSNQPNELVAVALTKGQMRVFEGSAVAKIIEFVGDVVEGGVAFTLQVGSALWHLVMDLPATAIVIVHSALKAAAWVLSHGVMLVVDGVTFVVKTGAEILKAVAELLKYLLSP